MKNGYDIPCANAIIIGDITPIKPRFGLYDYDTNECVFYKTGEVDQQFMQARDVAINWFLANGGKTKWPNGLQFRFWNS